MNYLPVCLNNDLKKSEGIICNIGSRINDLFVFEFSSSNKSYYGYDGFELAKNI